MEAKEKDLLSEGIPCEQIELEEFYGDGRRILTWFKKYCSKFYSKSGYELVGIEIPLNANIKTGVHFIGFIDIVLKDLVKILHPELLIGYKPFFFEKLK
mgnify:CR=1 FL=1